MPTTPVRTMEHVMVDGRETMKTVAVNVDGMVITVSLVRHILHRVGERDSWTDRLAGRQAGRQAGRAIVLCSCCAVTIHNWFLNICI